jgi:hypothetical protein
MSTGQSLKPADGKKDSEQVFMNSTQHRSIVDSVTSVREEGSEQKVELRSVKFENSGLRVAAHATSCSPLTSCQY